MARAGPEPGRACPLCSAPGPVDAGPVLHGAVPRVGGVPINLADLTFRFQRCRGCGFLFKDPPVPEDRLADCYRRSAAEYWGSKVDPYRRRYDLIARLAREHAPGKRVLDIGCSTGSLLEYLGPSWERFGVEPGESAAAEARGRGVKILGAALPEAAAAQRFDVILAVDVLEHVAAPAPFLGWVRDLLARDGIFLIVTGDTASPAWRFCGPTYWYGNIAEHVSFYSRRTIRYVEARFALECVEYQRRTHERKSFGRALLELGKNGVYPIGRAVRGLGWPPLRRRFVEQGAPAWFSAPDHMFCVLRRRREL